MQDPALKIDLQKANAHFTRSANPKESRLGTGTFFMLVEIEALAKDIYIPVSIASGKKPAGFIYQIEGTETAALSTASVSAEGKGITELTVGTIVYAKIAAGMKGVFRIQIEMRGKGGEEYQVAITQLHYKFAPADARYQAFAAELLSKKLEA